ncbi:MAG: flavodoxin family protein [Clostridia bacterium]|jgi:multimeric flavodoxin WrbA|nr:flavodoxin family protein [Clostridia bacterium]
MKILIIYGTPHIGNTHTAVSIFKQELSKFDNFEFDEVFLPKDLPNFCLGCHNCIKKSESLCSSNKNVKEIITKIINSDAIIVSSPVYVMSMSAPLKNLFDHLAYSWMPHRPNPNFFGKKTIVITTAAGAGMKKCINDIQINLKWLGFEIKHSIGIPIAAWNWDEMKFKVKKEEKIKKAAKLFYKDISNKKAAKKTLFTRFMTKILGIMIKTYSDDNEDKKYWLQNKWI